jgi:hypothetical protein
LCLRVVGELTSRGYFETISPSTTKLICRRRNRYVREFFGIRFRFVTYKRVRKSENIFFILFGSCIKYIDLIF